MLRGRGAVGDGRRRLQEEPDLVADGTLLQGSAVWTRCALPVSRVTRCGHAPGVRGPACGSAPGQRSPPRSPNARPCASGARPRSPACRGGCRPSLTRASCSRGSLPQGRRDCLVCPGPCGINGMHRQERIPDRPATAEPSPPQRPPATAPASLAGSPLGPEPAPISRRRHAATMIGRQGLRPLAVFVCGLAGGSEPSGTALSGKVRGGAARRVSGGARPRHGL